ncbi:MAG: NAD(P)H-quinone oxidoreductase [Alphaproteobacteria bacterium]|nr:MAG: NAD(P)H-quinone oxidoreductase [Alphaproteobacteria bacterium]
MTSLLVDEMKAVEITRFGGPEVLGVTRISVPRPGRGEVLIRVAAAGVNRPDVVQREGHYPPPPGAPQTPGLEVAGTIVAAGAGVTNVGVGDQVCALVAGGGYAEYCLAPAPQCLPVPKGLSLVEAAALPETFFTVWSNVFDRGRLRPGESFLVHGGTSGIGTTAIQLAHALGATVFATAGSAEKCARCRDLGAAFAINYREEDFAEIIARETEGRGVDLILDMVGGDYIDRNIRSLAVEGRLVQIAFLKGPRVEVNMLPVMLKRLVLTGSTLRAREVEFKAGVAAALKEKVWPLIEAGKVRPVIDSTYPVERVVDAHKRIDSPDHIGKIVLTFDN